MTRRPADFDEHDEALPDDVGAQFEALADRHRADPPPAVLRAADADALPSPLQENVAAGLGASAWQQTIVRGATAAGDEAAVDADMAERLIARVHREAVAGDAARRARRQRVVAATAGLAAVVVLGAALLLVRRPPDAPAATTEPEEVASPLAETTAPPAAPVVPQVQIPIDPAPVKLTARALVLRNDSQQAQFVDDAAPAFDAYRAGDYRTAADAFARLAARYPSAVEIPFYLGVSRLLVADAPGAVAALRTARAAGEATFQDDIAWYLAAAEARAGDLSAARDGLTALCNGQSAFAPRACTALAALPADPR